MGGEGANKGSEIYMKLIGLGKEIEPFDAMIAGTMLAAGETEIITGNTKHFENIEELTIYPLK